MRNGEIRLYSEKNLINVIRNDVSYKCKGIGNNSWNGIWHIWKRRRLSHSQL